MRNKKIVSVFIMAGVLLTLCACQSNNRMIPASEATETVSEKDSSSTEEKEDKKDKKSKRESKKQETTEASENVTQIVSRNTSEKLMDSTGRFTISVAELDGFARNFGSPNLIQYISTESLYADISYQIYEDYDEAKVLKMAETFASSSSYGNSIKDKPESFTFSGKAGDFNGYMLSYSADGGRVVYQMLLMKTLRENCVLAITYQQDNEPIDQKDISKFLTKDVVIDGKVSSTEAASTEEEAKTE